MKFSIAILLLSFFLYGNSAQGQINQKSLAATKHSKDSSAHASYLLHKAWVSFDIGVNEYQLVTRFEEIIKIYDDQGEDYANFEVYMYREGRDRQSVYDIKGTTYNFENGKEVKTKLEKKDIYTDEVNDDMHIKKWAMPNVRAGSIIEISYTKRSPWIYTIPRYDFQKAVPLDVVEYEVQIPTAFTYTPIATGLVNINKEEKNRSGKTGWERVFLFTAQDVPGLKDDDYVLDIDDYRASMKYEIYQVDFPNQPVKSYSKSWADIAKNLRDHDLFGKEINRKIPDLKDFIEGLKDASKEDKIKAVFSKVQNSYVWNKDYGMYVDEGVKDLVKNGSGNIADMNLLLLNLLNQLDVEAKPLCIKSRWRGVLNPYYPSVSELNYVVAYVPLGEGKYILMDASSKKTPMGQLPTRAVNMHGLLMSGDQGEIIALKNPNEFSYTALNKYEIDLKTPAIVGSGKSLRKGYAATKYRIEKSDEKEEEEKDQDEDGEEDGEEVKVENEATILEVKGMDDIYDKITVSFEEKLYNEIDIIGDQIFIDATLDFGISKNPFFEEQRTMPIFYNYLQSNTHISTIKIPEGYKLESIPETIAMSLEDGSISFRYEAREIAGNIKIEYVFNVNNDVVSPGMYIGLREIYNRIIGISKQKIVLIPI